LIVEGIHCLNERLTEAVPGKYKFKIYVSALTQLSIDDHNRISTTDTRILRRMIRDKNFRNYDSNETLKRFTSVIRGEKKNIFPLQEGSDFIFNSALVYELAVLKDFAIPLLRSIPESDDSYSEARRLLNFLELFRSVSADEVPPTSILREYIGGSSFNY
jgi:uridine kinase